MASGEDNRHAVCKRAALSPAFSSVFGGAAAKRQRGPARPARRGSLLRTTTLKSAAETLH